MHILKFLILHQFSKTLFMILFYHKKIDDLIFYFMPLTSNIITFYVILCIKEHIFFNVYIFYVYSFYI